jgi:hypothetical protein
MKFLKHKDVYEEPTRETFETSETTFVSQYSHPSIIPKELSV